MTKNFKNRIKKVLAWILICTLIFDVRTMANLTSTPSNVNESINETIENSASPSDIDSVDELDENEEDEEDEDAVDTNDYVEEPEEDTIETDEEVSTPSDVE